MIAALLTIISGGYVLFFTLLCISLIGMQELYKAMGIHEDRTGLLEIVGYLGAVLYYISLLLGFESYGLMAVLVSLILVMFVMLCIYISEISCKSGNGSVFGMVYVAAMLSFILMTKKSSGWQIYCLADFSLLMGMRYLRVLCGHADRWRKIAPVLSPKKSVEGGVGGVVEALRYDLCCCDTERKWWNMQ